MLTKDKKSNDEDKKVLYDYQKDDINRIFERLDNAPSDYHLLYQLPTGGGKTVIFSEITRRYLEQYDKKVVVLTHRIELCKQTSKMLTSFNVKNKIINSSIKELPDQNEYSCFVAMIETLKNRLNDHRRKKGNEVEMVEIDECLEKDKKLIETMYIQLFKSWGFELLNQNEGGGGPKYKSEESIQKYKNWRQGKKPMLGKKQSEITKKRKSEALKGKPKPEGFGDMMRQVRQGVPKPKGMGEKVSKNRDHKKVAEKQQKSILQFDLDNNLIKEWPSIKHAAEGTNSNASTISKVCRGIFKKTNGFIWKFK